MAPEFNLLTEPWILVGEQSGETKPLSIREVFVRAHELSGLSGELGAQDAAILRLLLGILYSIYTRVDDAGKPLKPGYGAYELWERLWTRKSFSMDVIGPYLDKYADRFWLFHDIHPFWQIIFDELPTNAEGITLKPTAMSAAKMIGVLAETEQNPNLFGGRRDKRRISFSEAARWLVYINAFDVSPGGTPGKNPKTVKGYGHPFPANLGLIWANGGNLFETLMLNLVFKNNGKNWPDGSAWWEIPPPCTSAADLERIQLPPPESIVELMTMQYRYIRLLKEDGFVTGYELWSGVNFGNTRIEQMTSWASNKSGERYPRAHDPAKQMWRDFASFAPSSENDNYPGIIKWLDSLHGKVQLPVLQLNIAGVTYKKDTAISDAFSDRLQVNAKLLHAIDEGEEADESDPSRKTHGWVVRITAELQTTEKMIYALSVLASDLALASGMPKGKRDADIKQKRSAAKEQAYFRMDAPFRKWLAEIDPTLDDIDETCAAWRRDARAIILRFGTELTEQAGPHAIRGHVFRNKETKTEEWFTAPDAYSKFRAHVRKICES